MKVVILAQESNGTLQGLIQAPGEDIIIPAAPTAEQLLINLKDIVKAKNTKYFAGIKYSELEPEITIINKKEEVATNEPLST